MKNLTLSVALLAVGILSAACSSATTNTNTNTTANTTANTSNSTAANANATTNTSANTSSGTATTGSLADPKSSIAYQFNLVKAGDVEKLKACLTPRAREGVTKEIVDKAKVDSAQYTIDDLYASAEMGESEGKKTAKVKMKTGRTLTTLIETDGKWLADTVWFK